MTSKECLSDLYFLAIGDENHTKKCKEIIEKDLDRLEKLEKTFDILKVVLDRVLIFKFKEDIISGWNIYISKIDSNNTTIVNLRKPEYELLKEVLENDKRI